MKPPAGLTPAQLFAAAVALREKEESDITARLDRELRKWVPVHNRDEYLAELDRRIGAVADAKPYLLKRSGFEHPVPLPAPMIVERGVLKGCPSRPLRETFRLAYEDLRRLESVNRLIREAKSTNTGLHIQLPPNDTCFFTTELSDLGTPGMLQSFGDRACFYQLTVRVDSLGLGFDSRTVEAPHGYAIRLPS